MGSAYVYYNITGSQECLEAVNRILSVFDDQRFLCLDIRLDNEKIKISNEGASVDDILEWTAIVRDAMKVINVTDIHFKQRGIIDYDYGNYKVFDVDCQGDVITKREFEYYVDEDFDWGTEDDVMNQLEENSIKSEDAETKAYKKLDRIVPEQISDIKYEDYHFEELIEELTK